MRKSVAIGFGGTLVLLLATAAIASRRADSGARLAASLADSTSAAPPASTPARRDTVVRKPPRPATPGVEVVINIPSGRLELFEGSTLVKSYPVSVGSARYPTPRGSYKLSRVVWNPWWHPPESEWARNRKPTPPGTGNPMGRAKLHLDDLYYIHGTTAEGRLGAPASHGCIRMSNRDVIDLAQRVHRYSKPDITDARIEELSTFSRQERETTLPRYISVRITYEVASVRGDSIRVFPDVYGRMSGEFSAKVRQELARVGYATTQLTAAAMTRLRTSAARGGGRFALADLATLQPLPAVVAPPPVIGTETVSEVPAAPPAVAPAEPAPADTAASAPAPDPAPAPPPPGQP
ncbi:MAG TPA: L,D-transpeptidase [Longimicrobium sp.]|uniref:L,D-transpeptidase n=1 Tax=Longimicrobium sp. TaxID=2029185 RepID=UPI002ED7B660